MFENYRTSSEKGKQNLEWRTIHCRIDDDEDNYISDRSVMVINGDGDEVGVEYMTWY